MKLIVVKLSRGDQKHIFHAFSSSTGQYLSTLLIHKKMFFYNDLLISLYTMYHKSEYTPHISADISFHGTTMIK